ncbi:onanonoxo-7-onima-8-eninoihtemlysoneda [Lineolata rhizophorae]|uniref:Onanonoxo-7-onima-8-eninoihtemlysoneda n=1 Tax=Lineolata rhizophorae TaxID=578093 RepID=A0A6A6NT98_9PEZI|nr:onanonoxo-7-onima-8-eninoihtemlysoneda [Lineolata rhizophorae]
MLRPPPGLWPNLVAAQIFGAHTGVGKTIVSALLCRTLSETHPSYAVHYLKPVSTGPEAEADDRHICRFAGKRTQSKCLFQFSLPVSPHVAARLDGNVPSAESLIGLVSAEFSKYAKEKNAVAVVETAGGVLSPGPSAESQADLYRPLRLPVILVADHRLGGIGTSLSAYESLRIRGYDVDAVVIFKNEENGGILGNHEYLSDFFRKEVKDNFFVLNQPPAPVLPVEEDQKNVETYYERAVRDKKLGPLATLLVENHKSRIEKLGSLVVAADKAIWHPFTQHQGRSTKDILTIDSAYGDFFQTLRPETSLETSTNPLLQPAFDGSASWWTQGLGHGNPKFSLAAAYAAGRYGHVMFAGAVHEPAVALADMLLAESKNPRLSRVFYTDNGSTGTEVAMKMALRASAARYRWDSRSDDILAIGLKGSYHGDTIGAMDMSEPSTFNEKVEWYRGRGFWFDFPQVQMRNGAWTIEPPTGMESEFGPPQTFGTLQEIFDGSRIGEKYRLYIRDVLTKLVRDGKKLGALILEPVILGAGGMVFADPLFQRTLVDVIRKEPEIFNTYPSSGAPSDSNAWAGLPVVSDEVFTGLYRLGHWSASSLIGVDPDIVVNAKLLTGGVLPLCTTTASESIFEAFLDDDKSSALLHGHSYTAHAVGCTVAITALKEMKGLEASEGWEAYRLEWNPGLSDKDVVSPSPRAVCAKASSRIWSMWSQDFVSQLSYKTSVDSVWALGSVLVIKLRDVHGQGYTSNAAAGLQKHLLNGQAGESWSIHSRVLGNVLYLMTSMQSSPIVLKAISFAVLEALD